MAIFKLFKHQNTQDRFIELLRPYVEGLYRLAYRFCGSKEDAEDLVQDLLVKLYPKVEELEQVNNLQSWLATVMYRQFVDRSRRNTRSPVRLVDDEEYIEAAPSDIPTPEAAAVNDQTGMQLQQALDKLSEEHRAIVILHDVEGFKLPELEQMLDIPLGTLKSRLHRAREQLKKRLKPEKNL